MENKERPILFNDEMVRAILSGAKTQTRRVMKLAIPSDVVEVFHWDEPQIPKALKTTPGCFADGHDGLRFLGPCPYGTVGDRLWVREAWADVNTGEGPGIAYRSDKHVQTWHDFCGGSSMDYRRFPGNYTMWFSDLFADEPGHSWKPSIHMPRWASRITLEITGIRVERLHEITDHDALAEGVTGEEGPWDQAYPQMYFQTLWDRINAKRGFPWASNPWVWVIEFKRAA